MLLHSQEFHCAFARDTPPACCDVRYSQQRGWFRRLSSHPTEGSTRNRDITKGMQTCSSDHLYRKTTFFVSLNKNFSSKPVLEEPVHEDHLPIKTTFHVSLLIVVFIFRFWQSLYTGFTVSDILFIVLFILNVIATCFIVHVHPSDIAMQNLSIYISQNNSLYSNNYNETWNLFIKTASPLSILYINEQISVIYWYGIYLVILMLM